MIQRMDLREKLWKNTTNQSFSANDFGIFGASKSTTQQFQAIDFMMFEPKKPEKKRRPREAGSRLFFAEFRDRNRREKWAALEDQA